MLRNAAERPRPSRVRPDRGGGGGRPMMPGMRLALCHRLWPMALACRIVEPRCEPHNISDIAPIYLSFSY